MIIIHVPFMRPDGMALFPFVLVKARQASARIIHHERIHLRQQLEMGLLLFYIWYLLEFLIRLAQYRDRDLAYRNICFEREAYFFDEEFAYLKTRRRWAFLKFLFQQ